MEVLKAAYESSASSSHEEDTRKDAIPKKKPMLQQPHDDAAAPLLPPAANLTQKNVDIGKRIRSFPHIEGNYALHVYIPVNISAIAKEVLAPLVKKAGLLVPDLYAIETDLPLFSCHAKIKDCAHVDAPLLAKQYHISLSRTVAIRVHQIDSIVAMLRHKLHSQKQYTIEFGKWGVFINDEKTRSFLALEVTTSGLSEISKQVLSVDEVFRLHNLPEFYKNPRPHISVAWGLGDITSTLEKTIKGLNRLKGNAYSTKAGIWSYTFSRIECKIGRKIYPICKVTT